MAPDLKTFEESLVAGLSFQRLRLTNMYRVEACFHAIDAWQPWEWSNATAGEGGEVAIALLMLLAAIGNASNLTKKMGRMWPANMFPVSWNKPEDQNRADLVDRLGSEIADVIIYADLLAASVGLDLAEVVTQKFNKKSDEIGSSIKL